MQQFRGNAQIFYFLSLFLTVILVLQFSFIFRFPVHPLLGPIAKLVHDVIARQSSSEFFNFYWGGWGGGGGGLFAQTILLN